MALGSQKWKGNWADFVKAPSRIRTRLGRYQGWARMASPEVRITESSKLPAMCPSSRRPPSRARPPAPVMVRASRAPLRASARPCQKLMSRKDDRLVSSQKASRSRTFSARTSPSMAPMKKSRLA